MEARSRYASVIKALADKYPNENLLLVTHGEYPTVHTSLVSVPDKKVLDLFLVWILAPLLYIQF